MRSATLVQPLGGRSGTTRSAGCALPSPPDGGFASRDGFTIGSNARLFAGWAAWTASPRCRRPARAALSPGGATRRGGSVLPRSAATLCAVRVLAVLLIFVWLFTLT